jgi:hypothetical protein
MLKEFAQLVFRVYNGNGNFQMGYIQLPRKTLSTMENYVRLLGTDERLLLAL